MALKEFLVRLVDLAMPVNALVGYSAYALCTIIFSSCLKLDTHALSNKEDEPKA